MSRNTPADPIADVAPDVTYNVASTEIRLSPVLPADPVLAATTYTPPGADSSELRPGLVVAHGAGSNRTRHSAFAERAAAAGFVTLVFDFRGHGDSGGLLDAEAHRDVIRAVDALRDHPLVQPDRICVRGSSMGALLGIRAARDLAEAGRNLAGLALLCPANERVMHAGLERAESYADAPEAQLPIRVDAAKLRQSFLERDVFKDAQRLEVPTLIVHARGDETVPFRDSLELAAGLRGLTEIRLLPGGDHRTAQSSPELHAYTATWLMQRCGTERGDTFSEPDVPAGSV